MLDKLKQYQQLAALFQAIVAIALSIVLSGCGTTEYMETKYAGHKVLDKNAKAEVRTVPVRVTSCVMPSGLVLCERRYGALTDCTLKCKTPENHWVERPEGYGGYEEETFVDYFMVLESPAGVTETVPVSELQYNGFGVGQIIGGAAP